MREPISAGERTVATPAASSAANLPSAVPLPPLMIAPVNFEALYQQSLARQAEGSKVN